MRKQQIRHFRNLTRQFQRVTGALLQAEPCCGGVTLAQCHVLLEIGERAGITLGELAGVLGLDKSTLSRTVDGLVDRGLVERRPNPEDRRRNLHLPTSSGEDVLAEIHRVSDERVRRTFDQIPAVYRARVLGALQVLVEAMGAAESCCAVERPAEGNAA